MQNISKETKNNRIQFSAEEAGSRPIKKIENKLELWESKLLDLTTRNMLLSLSKRAAVMPVMSSHVEELEDALASGQEFRLKPAPDWITQITVAKPGVDGQEDEETAWLPEMVRTAGLYEIDQWPVDSTADYNEKIRQDYEKQILYTFCDQKHLDSGLTSIYRASRASMQENGVSSLYMSIGLLRWYAAGTNGQLRSEPCYAPLILMPVEMIRRPANQGYALQAREEEPHFNLTLLEKLRREYNIEIFGVDPLPSDEHGIDIIKTFKTVRTALEPLKDWDVIETCVIGNFSFAQFAIWRDIHTGSAMLEKNKVVRSLMRGHVDWSTMEMAVESMWDKAHGNTQGNSPETAQNLYLPITVDATQRKAIEMAAAGRTFVLHGPPGTGKSQTITGMIANLAAQGKTVLFVAEKMAALTVVQRRLTALGLSDFCLELHSDKANRKHILSQLDRALAARSPRHESGYEAQAELTRQGKERLDGYARSLHTIRNCGYSLRRLVDLYESVRETPESISFRPEDVGSLTKEQLQSHRALIGQLVAAGAALGNIKGSPLKGIGLQSYNAQVRSSVQKNAENYANSLTAMQLVYDQTIRFLKEKGLWQQDGGVPFSAMEKIAALYFVKKDAGSLLHFLLEGDQTDLRAYYEKTDAEIADREGLLAIWKPEIFGKNLEEYLERHSAAERKLFFKNQAMEEVRREILAYTDTPFTYGEIPAQLQIVMNYQAERSALLGAYLSLSAEEKEALAHYPTRESYNRALGEALKYKEEADTFPGGLQAIRKLSEDRETDRILKTYKSTYETLCRAENAFNEPLQRRNLFGPEGNEALIRSELALCEYVHDHTAELKNIGLYNKAKEACTRAGLAPVVRAYEQGMPAGEIYDAYKKGLYVALINDVISRDNELSSFSGATFNEAIVQFKSLDDEMLKLTQKEIRQILASRIPKDTESTEIGRELNILRKAIKSNGRSVSIRELFSRIPRILQRLCPCMLMSPNSVAQYLAPENGLFDMVIFDEASQLPTCKAVGAIARADNAVIVGDPRQMPPTAFFAGGGPEVDDVALYDLDSILDDALALGIRSHYLQWHYRSTHESLIAFSNQEFYDNKMFTFPSADDREQRVMTVHVDGRYHDGTNPDEAEAVVAEILRRYRDPELHPLSIGVVTFNVKQQALIENLLADRFQENPPFDRWANDEEDPLFVKNLENVQGDERDAILFSIGYGPDEKGFVSNNFGPVNQAGGGKRLNVAFSRARVSMTIFASMRFTDIRVTENSPEGLIAFRDFLKYADTRPAADDTGLSASAAASEDGILQSVCSEIRKAGYRCDTMVGKSDFHVEIAVSDSNDPDSYMLGILLDGETYRRAGSTRDREIAQSAVLQNLGWKLHRIWTMDWWDNRQGEIRRLLSVLENCKAESDERIAEKEGKEEPESEKTGNAGSGRKGRPEIEKDSDTSLTNPVEKLQASGAEIIDKRKNGGALWVVGDESLTPLMNEFRKIGIRFSFKAGGGRTTGGRDAWWTKADVDFNTSNRGDLAPDGHKIPLSQEKAAGELSPSPVLPEKTPIVTAPGAGSSFPAPVPYVYAELAVTAQSLKDFKAKDNMPLIRERLLEVLRIEAPILKDTLFRRVLASFGVTKNGEALNATEKAFKAAKIRTTKQKGAFYCWMEGQKPEEYDSIRVAADRRPDELCQQEICNAVIYVLGQKGALEKDTLIKETSLVFGYKRLSRNLEAAIEDAVQAACTQGRIEPEGTFYKFTEKE